MKEVEIKNTIEIQNNVQTDSGVVQGYLTESGDMLNISIKNPLKPGQMRYVWVDKMVTDITLNKFIPSRVFEDTSDFNTSENELQVKLGDAYEVTTTDTVNDPNETITIDIDFYTYESNVTTDYGSKRLSMPYSMAVSSDMYNNAISESSDGWYQIGVLDIPIWLEEDLYEKGDLTYRDGARYIAIRQTAGSDPIEEGGEMNWKPMDIYDLYDTVTLLTSPSAKAPVLRILVDMIITRRVKYTVLYDLFRASDFNTVDDDFTIALINRVLALRESIKFYLHSYEPMKALQAFNIIESEYQEFKDNSSTTTVPDNYSSRVLITNNFTL